MATWWGELEKGEPTAYIVVGGLLIGYLIRSHVLEDIVQRFRAAGIPMAAPSIHVRS
ncbi:MAG: hypothetical protein HRU14_10115 [Planctomycetes bacterium]|jgi:ABC-type transport system involved in cytochrome c biogenesis permease subunit|nr:hypothetical protein [Planctomycetota bacterium]